MRDRAKAKPSDSCSKTPVRVHAVALAQGNDATAFRSPVCSEPPVHPVRTGVGWTDMAAEIGAVDLDRGIEQDLAGLDGKRFPQLMSQDKSCLVGDVNAA